MATPVTVTTYYRDDDFFEGKNSPVYVYGGSSTGGVPISPLNYYTRTQLVTDGVLDTRYYTETELLTDGVLDTRYYTETELNAGQLDTRYYTESELNAGQLDTRYYTETESDSRFVNVTGDETIAGVKTFTGTIKAEDLESADESYSSGFTGSGWTITDQGSNSYLAEFDDLIVRGSMSVYELIVNKIRATGGTMWVTDFVEALSDLTYYGSGIYYFETDPDNNTLAIGDKIQGQTFTGNNVRSYKYTVHSISSGNEYVRVSGATSTDETKGMTFVRVGSDSDTSRQGSLFMTSSLTNSPYLEVLDGMTTHTIGSSHRKARLGNLTGLTFDGSALGGYGLFSDSAFLQGKIVATEGDIGSWNINGGSLYSDTGTGDITLDADQAAIVIKDATDDIKVHISKDAIPSWSNSFSGSSNNYTGTAADAYSDVSQSSATGSGDNNTWYLQEYASSTYLDMFTSNQGVTRHFPIASENPYAVVIKWDTTLSYTIPADDTNYTDGETHAYSLGGSYDQTITVRAYTSAGTLLATQVNNFVGKTESLSDVTIFNKVIQTTDGYVYYTIQVNTTNNLQVDDFTTYWEEDETSHWVEIYSHTVATSLTTTFNMQVEELTQEGNVNQVSIGNNGFMHWSTDSKFFHVNEDETSYYIHYAGGTRSYGDHLHGSIDTTETDLRGNWIIRYPYSGNVGTSYDITTNAFNINTNHANGYALALHNDGNNVNRMGMLMRYGADTPTTTDNIAIRFEDGNGGYIGALYSDSGQLTLYYSSDLDLKGDIQDKEIDALEVINKLKYKSWKWRTKDKDNKPTDELGVEASGYIADEAEGIFPEMVKTDPDTGGKIISHVKLIPVLQTAIQLQQKQIEDLQEHISKIKIK